MINNNWFFPRIVTSGSTCYTIVTTCDVEDRHVENYLKTHIRVCSMCEGSGYWEMNKDYKCYDCDGGGMKCCSCGFGANWCDCGSNE